MIGFESGCAGVIDFVRYRDSLSTSIEIGVKPMCCQQYQHPGRIRSFQAVAHSTALSIVVALWRAA